VESLRNQRIGRADSGFCGGAKTPLPSCAPEWERPVGDFRWPINPNGRNPTLTPEALKEIIDQAVKEALSAREIQENSKAKADTRSKIVTAFVKVDPSKPLSAQTDVNVLTYGKWALDMGTKVKTGQRALRINGYHDQTEVMSPAERKEYFARQQAKAAKREAKEAAQAQASA